MDAEPAINVALLTCARAIALISASKKTDDVISHAMHAARKGAYILVQAFARGGLHKCKRRVVTRAAKTLRKRAHYLLVLCRL